MKENSWLEQVKKWWHTDCAFCKKTRLLLLWFILMLVVDYFWFHLLFKS